jgi:hypothetical protein
LWKLDPKENGQYLLEIEQAISLIKNHVLKML